MPGASASTRRTAWAITGADTGRRPAAASLGPPRRSARRWRVTKLTAATPGPIAASARRPATAA